MAKIPFDIKYRPQIESGEYKVETQDGRPARIACWDRQHKEFPLIVLISRAGGEDWDVYTINGKFYYNQGTSAHDLFIITPEPEVELSEFEDALKDCVNARNPETPMTDEGARNNATILLALARKEIEDELKEKVLHDYWKQVSDGYIQARKEGKAEALKDLPRWKKCGENTLRSYGGEHFEYRKDECYVVIRGREILLSDLEKLPEEE